MAKSAFKTRNRDQDLGPTGPAKMPRDAKDDYTAKHPNPGNVGSALGPTPSDDPRHDDPHHKVEELGKRIEEARKRTSSR
jgi:hypothetical protein